MEQLPDGEYAAWAEFLVDEEVWQAWEAEVAAAGAPGGMSFTFTEPIDNTDAAPQRDVQIGGDAAHFTDDEMTEAAARLSAAIAHPASAERVFQFNSVSTALVLVEFTTEMLSSLGPNLLASALWDACKYLWRPGGQEHERSRFNLTVRESRGGRRRLKLVIDVPDEAALDTALRRAPAVLQSAAEGTFDFKQSAGEFLPIDEATPPQIDGRLGERI
ncbi:MAG: hypothetical protein JWO62_2536 [Acidimicrobiaceae bacterium]|nr:hypothetical protein [Acidimicrobiaceae bacterium]